MRSGHALDNLNMTEGDCTLRYVGTLVERLGDQLEQIWLFGSAARGEMWPDWMPINSDIDLLVLTRHEIDANLADELVGETYPLFLECGRQIAPQFRTIRDFRECADTQRAEFYEQVREHGQVIYEKDGHEERCHTV